MYRYLWICALLVVGFCFVTGCSDKVQLKGKVTFSDNGEPLKKGTVIFESDTFMSRGSIQSDGTFVVGSMGEKDGIPKGDYRITIIGAMDTIEDPNAKKDSAMSGVYTAAPLINTYLIDRKYEEVSKSGLTFTVDGSKKECLLTVDRSK